MRRSLAWWVLAVGTLVWVLALTQGWLAGEPGRGPGGERKSAGGRFDPRDVPITVDVYEYGFNPTNVVIKAGHAVAWRDVGQEHHTIEPSTRAARGPFVEA